MTYMVNEMFWSMQGEGLRAGEMSVFIRFTGCNMLCRKEPGEKSPGGFDCDTEFASGRKMTGAEIAAEARHLVAKPDSWFQDHHAWVVLTGGEPALQVDNALIDELHSAGFKCAIETNGSVDVTGIGLDWVTVSPKVAEHAVRQVVADEIKYVRGHGQAIPKPSCVATYKFISPAFDGWTPDQRAIEWCIKLVKENPEWRLSIQKHKSIGVR
jgi:organic radical activating enzyme